jgi:hypothetical protein
MTGEVRMTAVKRHALTLHAFEEADVQLVGKEGPQRGLTPFRNSFTAASLRCS